MSTSENVEQIRRERTSTITPELLKSCQPKIKISNSTSTVSFDRRSARVQEKEELIELNDRLASYIDNVRRLENENGQLKEIVQNYSQSQESELKELRKIYDSELSEVRKMLDDVSRERARLEIDLSRFRSVASEADTKLKTKEADLYKLEEQTVKLEKELADIKARNSTLASELERRAEDLAKQRLIAPELERQLSKIQKQLESETLRRIDYENRNLTLGEELEFVRQVSAQELDRVRLAAAEVANLSSRADQIDVEERALNDSLMRQHLQEIRQETEDKIEQMRIEIDSTYRRRIEELDQQVSHASSTAQVQRTELEQCRRRISELCTDRDHLNSKLAARDKALTESEERNQQKQEQWEQRTNSLEQKLTRAHREYQALNEDYHQLLDLKVTLDQEIETYRRLVESEEERLNIPRKRRYVDDLDDEENQPKLSVRFSSSSQNIGPIAILDEDNESGAYIVLKNTSVHSVSIGGWVLSRSCNSLDQKNVITEHKFPRNTTIKPDEEIRVYSFNANGAVHDPPHSFIMPKGKCWPVGDCYITKVINLEDSEVAHRETMNSEEDDEIVDINKMPGHPVDTHDRQSSKKTSESGVASKLFGMFSFIS